MVRKGERERDAAGYRSSWSSSSAKLDAMTARVSARAAARADFKASVSSFNPSMTTSRTSLVDADDGFARVFGVDVSRRGVGGSGAGDLDPVVFPPFAVATRRRHSSS